MKSANGLPYACRFDLIVLAGSAGSLNSVLRVIPWFPRAFPAAVMLIQHLSENKPNMVPQIVSRRTPLDVREVVDHDPIVPGTLYIARPGWHVTLEDGAFALTDTPPVEFVRPSIDVLLYSAAAVLGERLMAVILSGMGNDGSKGVQSVHAAGGTVLAEDPGQAVYAAMPRCAVTTGMVDFVLPLEEIGPKILQLTKL